MLIFHAMLLWTPVHSNPTESVIQRWAAALSSQVVRAGIVWIVTTCANNFKTAAMAVSSTVAIGALKMPPARIHNIIMGKICFPPAKVLWITCRSAL
jgi:hypothetical protein